MAKERATARGNRLGLTLLGLVLLAGGGYALARGLGAFGALRAMERIAGPREIVFFARSPWIWWVIAAVALILALLALRWLLVQARRDAPTGLRLAEGPGGVTEVESSGVANALESDVTEHPAVLRARAAVTGTGAEPGVRLRMVADEEAPVDELRHHLGARAIPRMRESLEVEHLPAEVRLRLEPHRRKTRTLR
ncbi:hypothetical protein GCM10023259_011160 [Thermocatellispora tengchongensis]